MSYCIYLRKSRKDEELETLGELETLQRHYNTLLKLAKEKNIKIDKIYKEIVSGESINTRPEMQKLLKDVSNNTYDGVLVMEVERLARGNTIDQGIVAETFKHSNTKIITPYKTYNPNNEFDEEYFEFGLFMARREYKVINRRIQRGRLTSVSEGKYIASIAPYGYEKEKIKLGKGYTLKINEEQAKIVSLIYELYSQGMSLNAIANKLDTICKPLNSKCWSKSTIKDMRDAVEKVYWKVNKIIIYSCERVFPIGEKMDLVYLLNPVPMIEPRFLNTRIKLEDNIPLAVYEYVKWFSYNNKNVIIMVPDKEKLNKVYYTYKDNLKENNTRVIKYEKGDDFNNIEDIIKSEPVFIVTNSMGDYINRIEDVNILVLFGDDASYTYKRIVYLGGCIDVKSDILPEVLLVSRDTSMDMDKSREIIREFNKRLWEKKLLR